MNSLVYKFILVFILLVPFATFSQKYLLIDKDAIKPIIHSDTGTTKQVVSGYVGLYATDLDSVVISLKSLIDFFPPRTKKAKTIHINLAHSMLLGERIDLSYGDRYDINLYTFSGELSGKIILANSRLSNKINVQRINHLISYLSTTNTTRNQ